MVKEGNKYSRCKSECESGNSVCSTHSGKSKAVAIWVPEALPIEEKKIAIRAECEAMKFGPGRELVKCTNKSSRGGKYCSGHKHAYRLELAEDCIICLEANDQTKNIPLQCGHLFHYECLRRWNKDTCPTCRAKMSEEESRRYIVRNNEAIKNILTLGSRFAFIMSHHIRLLSTYEANFETESAMITLIRNWNSIASLMPQNLATEYTVMLESIIINDQNIQDLIARNLVE
jgi:Ring finger domain